MSSVICQPFKSSEFYLFISSQNRKTVLLNFLLGWSALNLQQYCKQETMKFTHNAITSIMVEKVENITTSMTRAGLGDDTYRRQREKQRYLKYKEQQAEKEQKMREEFFNKRGQKIKEAEKLTQKRHAKRQKKKQRQKQLKKKMKFIQKLDKTNKQQKQDDNSQSGQQQIQNSQIQQQIQNKPKEQQQQKHQSE